MSKWRQSLHVGEQNYQITALKKWAQETDPSLLHRLPYTTKILLENLLRHFDGKTIQESDLEGFKNWQSERSEKAEIAYRPARVLMQDFTGVPAVVDLAAMREAVKNLGGDPQKINPLTPVDLVIDHSVSVESYGNPQAFTENVEIEFKRNQERYAFLKWGQKSFRNFRVVPPGIGICHQVNLECLARVVWTKEEGGEVQAYPDTLVGTDSHTTMVNGLAVLGWGVGGIEAEAAMLGQPISMLVPDVVGVHLTGKLSEGITSTDLVLTITQKLREKKVVGKFVEFYGEGLDALSLADRATIANMAPEYGATCGFFPIDQETTRYLKLTNRGEYAALVEAYAKEQTLWRSPENTPLYQDTLEVNLSEITPSLAGPKRPQDRITLFQVGTSFEKLVEGKKEPVAVAGEDYQLDHGHVAIAAITSCTNTSNPSVMIAAGLVARKANALGLKVKPWVKTSLAPGSQVVSEYLEKSGLQKDLDALGFHVVGYGCTTCIGNSGPLAENIVSAINTQKLNVSSVLSGNRNFEGRISPHIKSNYLASPPLVVAYALKGSVRTDMQNDVIGHSATGEEVRLKDLWPTQEEIQSIIEEVITPEMFKTSYAQVFSGESKWQEVPAHESETYSWQSESTYVKNPPFFTGMGLEKKDLGEIKSARILALLGDSVTTDHISPAGSIGTESPAGKYLQENAIAIQDFNSFGSRRGNHEVMMRGTFGNIRIKNEMLENIEGGCTRHIPSKETMSIYDAAMRYQKEETPLVVIAGKEYGTGSSRDWAAKGTVLLGIKVVIAESFERIHRSNLIGMGVIPLQFKEGDTRKSLGLTGEETLTFRGIHNEMKPLGTIECDITYPDGESKTLALQTRIDTENELEYLKHGGILHKVIRDLL